MCDLVRAIIDEWLAKQPEELRMPMNRFQEGQITKAARAAQTKAKAAQTDLRDYF